MKISEYPKAANLSDDDCFIIDGQYGTRTMPINSLATSLIDRIGQGINHASLFRGQNLGTAFTSSQKAAITNGTFSDIWLGDFWVIAGVTWRVADFDYWFNSGDTPTTKHHIVLLPDTGLYTGQMNTTAIVTGGYAGSAMHMSGLSIAKSRVASAFPGYVLNHRENLSETVDNGLAVGDNWYDSTVEIPNEYQMYGHSQMQSMPNGPVIPGHRSNSHNQLALLRLAPQYLSLPAQTYWLRDIPNNGSFCCVAGSGAANAIASNTVAYVRPVVGIGA